MPEKGLMPKRAATLRGSGRATSGTSHREIQEGVRQECWTA